MRSWRADAASALVRDAGHGFLQGLGTAAQRLLLLRGKAWLEAGRGAVPADDRRQRQCDAICRAVAADRNDRPLITQHQLGDARRHHADAVLARVVAFDDGDVGVADVLLDAAPRLLAGEAALLENVRRR